MVRLIAQEGAAPADRFVDTPVVRPAPEVSDILRLRRAPASEFNLPVAIEGVVTFFDPEWHLLFVQDAQAGMFVQLAGLDRTQDPYLPGDRVRVDGILGAGGFAPEIDRPTIRRLGRAPLPEPGRPARDQLQSGLWDSRWVEVEGVVRGFYSPGKEDHLMFDLAVGPTRMLVTLPGRWVAPIPHHLVDARVRVRGVAGTLFNQRRQLVGLQLFVPSLEFVSVRDPAAPDPFMAVPTRIGSLFRWVSLETAGRRVLVQGTVTWTRGGDLYLDDGSGSLAVTLRRPMDIAAGDHIVVAGFPEPGAYSPVLRDAVGRRRDASAAAPPSTPVTASQLLSGLHDSSLVTLDAEVVSLAEGLEPMIVLRAGDIDFAARLQSGALARLGWFDPGSPVRVTGVCRVQVNELDNPRQPIGFELLLRSPDDVQPAGAVPWLTSARAVEAVGGLTGVGVLAAVWIAAIRRRLSSEAGGAPERLERGGLQDGAERPSAAGELVLLCDVTARVTTANDVTMHLIGPQVVGTRLADLFVPEHRAEAEEQIRGVIGELRDATFELDLRRAGGGRLTGAVDVRPILRQGSVVALLATGRDVTRAPGESGPLPGAGEARGATGRELQAERSSRPDGASADPGPGELARGTAAPGVPAGSRVLTVLVAEDNPVNQRLAQEILTRRGHRVVVAGNGREAMERFRAGRFDLVLMDVQMPELNGLAATRAIRELERGSGRRTPIIAMTAHAMAGDRERCLVAGMDDYLTKPIRAATFVAHVERVALTGIAARGDDGSASGPGRAVVPQSFDLVEALARMDSDEALLAEIAGLFLREVGGLMGEIRQAALDGDGVRLARSAHRLKGSVLNFGAGECAAAALTLERMGQAGRLEEPAGALAALDREIARLVEGLTPVADGTLVRG